LHSKDYYRTLGLNRNDSQEEVKKAYRRLALKYHPDRNRDDSEAENTFKKIGEAYAVLSDPEKRRIYDRFGLDQLRGGFQPEDIFGGFSFKDVFREFDGRFDDEIPRRFFRGFRGMGCGRRRGGFFGRGFFQSRSAGLWGNARAAFDIRLNHDEALLGTEKEIVVQRGWESQRIRIKIPPGVENDTVLSLSLGGEEGGLPKDRFYLRVKVV
jgi:curved DNA-binding protein